MSFANITQTQAFTGESNVRRTEYISLTPGAHVIRILNSRAKDIFVHYINKATVECLGDDCPICANNKSLISAFPNDFRNQPGYVKKTERHYVNVLDKTPAKVCECGQEYKDLSATFCRCGKQLPDAKPLMKVKVLAKGKTLFEHLETIHNSILDAENNPIGIHNYDISLVVSGTGRDVNYTPIPNPANSAPVEQKYLDEMFDLDKAIIRLTPEELLDLQRGISLKDIFAARRSKETAVVETQVPEEVATQVANDISKLFEVKS